MERVVHFLLGALFLIFFLGCKNSLSMGNADRVGGTMRSFVRI